LASAGGGGTSPTASRADEEGCRTLGAGKRPSCSPAAGTPGSIACGISALRSRWEVQGVDLERPLADRGGQVSGAVGPWPCRHRRAAPSCRRYRRFIPDIPGRSEPFKAKADPASRDRDESTRRVHPLQRGWPGNDCGEGVTASEDSFPRLDLAGSCPLPAIGGWPDSSQTKLNQALNSNRLERPQLPPGKA